MIRSTVMPGVFTPLRGINADTEQVVHVPVISDADTKQVIYDVINLAVGLVGVGAASSVLQAMRRLLVSSLGFGLTEAFMHRYFSAWHNISWREGVVGDTRQLYGMGGNDFMYRGVEHSMRIQLKNIDGTIVSMVGNETVVMRLAHSYIDGVSVLEKAGDVLIPHEGRFVFVLLPTDTINLTAKTYDRTILVDGQVVLQDRFGIMPQNPGMEV